MSNMIAWLGTGLLGSGFVRALYKRGHQVSVWNRTGAKAALLSNCANVCDSAAAAVKLATRIHLTLADDDSVDAVLAAATPSGNQLIIDHSTTDPLRTKDRAAHWAQHGVRYIHAPVFMGPSNAAEATGLMLLSGDRTTFAELEPLLAPMTGKLMYVGERSDLASVYKLCGNLFLMFFTAGIAEMMKLGKAHQVPSVDVIKLFDWFNPAASAGTRAKRMIDGDYANPSWELQMARKDARVMMDSAAGQVALTMLPAIIAEMDTWIERGYPASDWTVIGKDSVLVESSP
jgi:3-hydroxyisobutyrate dehydrogenase